MSVAKVLVIGGGGGGYSGNAGDSSGGGGGAGGYQYNPSYSISNGTYAVVVGAGTSGGGGGTQHNGNASSFNSAITANGAGFCCHAPCPSERRQDSPPRRP